MLTINKQDTAINFDIALVTSRFNTDVTERLYQGAIARLGELQFSDEQIHSVSVPGVIEIPLIAQQFAAQKKCQAIVMLGAVIRGETGHYDYVCSQVSDACQHISLHHNIPVIFGVLTTDNKAQALARVGGSHGHKGRDAIDTAVEMVAVMRELR